MQARAAGRPRLPHDAPLWANTDLPLQLGCSVCPDLALCGGLSVRAAVFDCEGLCACAQGKPCSGICRRNAREFVARSNEVGGFSLANVPRCAQVHAPVLPDLVPMLYDGTNRQGALDVAYVALPLLALFNRGTGTPRFESRETLARAFHIGPRTRIVLSGVATDHEIEKWWAFRERPALIECLRQLGVSMVTTPNYSLFTNVSRYDNLHSIKRIGLTWSEFVSGGVPCALHVNGRTERDYSRWREFIAARPEVDTLAFEFTTGTVSTVRGPFHCSQLVRIAQSVDRPLTLILRGGRRYMRELLLGFRHVVVVDPEPYVKTKFRRRARPAFGGGVEWYASPTAQGVPLDELLHHNVSVAAHSAALRAQWIRADYGHGKPRDPGSLLQLCSA